MRPSSSTVDDSSTDSRRTLISWLGPLLIASVAGLSYSNSFQGAFLFDDEPHFVENPTLHTLSPLRPILLSERPVLDLTLAANWVLGGADPWGFHLVNLIVHMLAALTLLGVVRIAMTGPRVPEPWRGRADGVALATALMWAAHPLNTQAVTYIVQRGESMMSFFYLLTLYALARSDRSPRRLPWSAVAVVACALGMGCKPVMVTAPVVALFFDRALLSGSFRESFRQRWRLHLALVATWLVLVPGGTMRSVLTGVGEGATHVGFGATTVTPWEYARTQPGVILHYLRLAFWPDALALDYGWPVATTAREIVPAAMVIGSLVVLTTIGLISRHPLSFPAFFFFAVLSPTSSFVPVKDLAFEHRMYLPLTAVVLLVVIAVEQILSSAGRRRPVFATSVGIAAIIAATTALSFATHERNKDYVSMAVMWRDAFRKRPTNPRALVAVGNELCRERRYHEAENLYRRALEIKPLFWDGEYNLGVALEWVGDLDGAAAAYRTAIRYVPFRWEAHEALGRVLNKQSRPREAIEVLRAAADKAPSRPLVWVLLGQASAAAGNYDGAMDSFRRAVSIDSSNAWTLVELGNTLSGVGRDDQAVEAYRAALTVAPRDGVARLNLGNALGRMGRLTEALAELEHAAQLEPSMIEAQYSFATALRLAERNAEAMEAFRRTLALAPDHAEARAAFEELAAEHDAVPSAP